MKSYFVHSSHTHNSQSVTLLHFPSLTQPFDQFVSQNFPPYFSKRIIYNPLSFFRFNFLLFPNLSPALSLCYIVSQWILTVLILSKQSNRDGVRISEIFKPNIEGFIRPKHILFINLFQGLHLRTILP